MRDEPIHKPKGVVFGPTIVYDAERCIMCTRCVRVSAELAKDPVLSMRERGNLNEITVAPGRQLDHNYTLMTEYVCPVGALTSSDFRFKARVWFLRSARSTCVGCATVRSFRFRSGNQHVYRYRPRETCRNNRMCDEGLLDYQRIHQTPLLEPRSGVRRFGRGGDRQASDHPSSARRRLRFGLRHPTSNEDTWRCRPGKEIGRTASSTRAAPGKGDEIL